MAKQIIRSIRKGSVQWNEEDRLQMVSMLAKVQTYGFVLRFRGKQARHSRI